MNVWKGTVNDPDLGNLLVWAGSESACKKLCKEVAEEGDYPDNPRSILTIVPMKIPTDKAGLIEWLNSWFGTDNG